MTEAQVIALINQWIIANGNNEITADVLRPILLAMVGQPNDVTGDLSDLSTGANTNLVAAINWLNTQISGITGNYITLHQGNDDPNVTPPSTFSQGDFYLERLLDNTPIQLWQYNVDGWKLVVAGAGDQDNQFIPYKISIVKGDTNMAQRVAITINSLPSFTVTEKQIPLFYVREFESDSDSTVVSTSVWGLAYIGKGTYGFGGTIISSGYLLNISPPVAPSQSTVPPDAVQITISGSGTPEDILNAQNPPIFINSASDTPTIITTDDGVYWWLGSEGTYGVGGDTAVAGDFQLLPSEAIIPTHTSDLINDGNDGSSPFATLENISNTVTNIYNLAAVARINVSTGVWSLINDANHQPINITGIYNGAPVGFTDQDFNFTVTYPTIDKVGQMIVSPDETYSKLGLFIGVSVAMDAASIKTTKNGMHIKIAYSGSDFAMVADPLAVVLPAQFSYSFDGGSGHLTVTHSALKFNYADQILLSGYDSDLIPVLISKSSTSFVVMFEDASGNPVLTQSTDMNMQVDRFGVFFVPNDCLKLSSSNMWIAGTHRKLGIVGMPYDYPVDTFPTDNSDSLITSGGVFDMLAAAITDGDTTHAPTGEAVFEGLKDKGSISGDNAWLGVNTFGAGLRLSSSQTITNSASANRFTLYVGHTTASPYVSRNAADALAAFKTRNLNAASTGNIHEFDNDIGLVAGVRRDGRVFGSNGTAINDFATLAQVPRQLKDFYTDVSNVGTTETDLYSYTIPANTLSAVGQKIVFKHSGISNIAGPTKSIWRVRIAGTAVSETVDGGVGIPLILNGVYRSVSEVIRIDTDSIRVTTDFFFGKLGVAGYTITNYVQVDSLNFASTIVIKSTIQTDGASNDLTAKMGNIVWHPAAP